MHICCTLSHSSALQGMVPSKGEAVRDDGAGNGGRGALLLIRANSIGTCCVPLKGRSFSCPERQNEITELISPGLGNIGIFLPYTEMQHLLFSFLPEDALIMTSANVPGDPMVLRDEDAMSLKADCYPMHDREIVNRCDDSVVRGFPWAHVLHPPLEGQRALVREHRRHGGTPWGWAARSI